VKFRATPRIVGDVLILDLSGSLKLGEGSDVFRNSIRKFLDEGRRRILLNLAAVEHLDSSGIGELVSDYSTARREGGEIKLLKLSRAVDNALLATKLYTLFDIHNDEAEAVASFR